MADVPALLGVRPQAVPGGLQHLDGVPLRDALLDSSGEDRGGALAVQRDGLVGGEQRHASLLQIVFDLGAEEGAACDSFY
ncbi:hypothetical protein [Nonomuraea sp. NPDC049400]|uniref:hypothetical protein n=1 Tax=Nonomuraea sp. NPDC049400 TaxID=3364352 RepID=UPI0037BDDB05